MEKLFIAVCTNTDGQEPSEFTILATGEKSALHDARLMYGKSVKEVRPAHISEWVEHIKEQLNDIKEQLHYLSEEHGENPDLEAIYLNIEDSITHCK